MAVTAQHLPGLWETARAAGLSAADSSDACAATMLRVLDAGDAAPDAGRVRELGAQELLRAQRLAAWRRAASGRAGKRLRDAG